MADIFIEGEVEDDAPLNLDEVAERESYEKVIRDGTQVFVEVGTALASIRAKRLYRDFGTWEQYLREKFPVMMSVSHANNLIAAAEVAGRVPVPTERAARALRRAKGDTSEVWVKAVENTGGDPTKVTAKAIEEADRQVRGVPTESEEAAKPHSHREAVYASVEDAKSAIDAYLSHFRQARQALLAIGNTDAAHWIDTPGVGAKMKQAAEHIKAAKPYARCGVCLSKPNKSCEACHGGGWVPRFKHDALPAKRQGPVLGSDDA
jgi:hypothetical protein